MSRNYQGKSVSFWFIVLSPEIMNQGEKVYASLFLLKRKRLSTSFVLTLYEVQPLKVKSHVQCLHCERIINQCKRNITRIYIDTRLDKIIAKKK